MPEISLTVGHEVGLHARPAAQFAKTARQFGCDLTVAYGELQVNAKSILRVLTLGVFQGSEITIRAEGEDADQALTALEALIERDFQESA